MIAYCGKRLADRSGDGDNWWRRGEEIFAVFGSLGIKHNVATYNLLISMLGKGKQLQKALDVFDEMRRRGVAPTVVTFNSLITACGKGGRLDQALEVFRSMKADGIIPDVITYSALITACGKVGQVDRALEVFQNMKADRIVPNVITYSALITALGKAGRFEETDELFREMEKKGVPANDITYHTFLDAACTAGRQEEALRIFEDGARVGFGRGSAAAWSSFMAESHIIDLHGLSEKASRVAILSWLSKLHMAVSSDHVLWEGRDHAEIITGWGKHNDDGQSVVKAAVWTFLTAELQSPLDFWTQHSNGGALSCSTPALRA